MIEGVSDFRIPKADLPFGGRAAEELADLPFLTGNQVELLIDGEDPFGSILEGIEKAQEYVLFQFFIIKNEELGTRLKDLLVKKSSEGVKVRVLYDEIGSIHLSKAYIRGLQNADVEVHAFNTRKGPKNRFQINFRNHRKIVVV